MTAQVPSMDKLVLMVQELGRDCTVDEESFRRVVLQCPPVSEQTVAELLGLIARSMSALADPASAASAPWNINVVVDVLKQVKADLDWGTVAELLDFPDFFVPDGQSFTSLAAAFKRGAGTQIPVRSIVGRQWRNMQGQLSLILQASLAAPEVYTFENAEDKLSPVQGLQGGRSAFGYANHAWLCRDLLEVLCSLTESGQFPAVRQILEVPAKTCPEVLLTSFAAIPGDFGLLPREVFGALFPMFLDNSSPNSRVVLRGIWAINQGLILEILVEFYSQDQSNIERIVDICLDLQALDIVLNNNPYPFTLELACAAARRELLNLEKWLVDIMARDATTFLPAVLRFLDHKTQVLLDGTSPVSKVPLPQDAVRALLRSMQQSRSVGSVPDELAVEVQRVQQQCHKMFPALVQGSEKFASEVEAEANTYFQQVYRGVRSVDEVVAMLQTFRSSPVPREQEVFACMLHNLFDEYKFFSRYPDKELHQTALLFGALVQKQMVSSITLGLALGYILDALRKPSSSKMFTFGIEAVRQFGGSLAQFPPFCVQLVLIPSVKEVEPELFKRAEAVAQEAGGVGGHGPPLSSNDLQVNVRQLGGIPFLGAPLSPHSAVSEARPGLAAPVDSTMGAGAAAAVNLPENPSSAATAVAAATALPVGVPQASQGGAAGLPPLGPGGNAAAPAAAAPAPAPANARVAAIGASHRIDTSVDMDDKDDTDLALAAQVASSSLMPANAKDAPSLAAQVNTESLESAAEKYKDFKEPPVSITDRVHFLINNMTVTNIDSRAVDLKEKVYPEFVAWFANYLVVKRAAQEANFHTLYVTMCDKMKEKDLYKLLIKTTLYYVKILLYSERTVKESNDRALLKNLGVWLGLLTFGKNRPVLSKELELKKVLVEAYQRGRLIAVLPFMQKLLECCKDSKVFRPTNPMINGILSLLAELHSLKGLKINNVFCIELVFKAFSITAEDVKPTDLLKRLPRERQCNQDWGIENLSADVENTTPLPGPEGKLAVHTAMPAGSKHASGQSQVSMQGSPSAMAAAAATARGGVGMSPLAQASGQDVKAGTGMVAPGEGGAAGAAEGAGSLAHGGSGAGMEAAVASNLQHMVIINPQLAPYAAAMQLQRIVPPTVEEVIIKILLPAVERSVAIACYTTLELLVKDFAMDPDENRMRKAAHLMVSSLAGSFSLVSCRESLRANLILQIKMAMPQPSHMSIEAYEGVVNLLVHDNLEMCCNLCERSTAEKALRDVDKLLRVAYEERSKARAQGKAFVDTSSFHGRFPQSLPESLRPRPGQLNPLMLKMYEDFARIPRTVAALSNMGGAPVGVAGRLAEDPGGGGTGRPGAGVDPAAYFESYLMWQNRSDAAIYAKDAEGPGADQTTLQQLLQELSLSVSDIGVAADEVALFVTRKLLKHLNDGGSKLHTTFYVACIEALALGPAGKRLPEELSRMVIEEESRVSKEIVEMLARGRILSLPELDDKLLKTLLLQGKHAQAVTELLLHLMKTCMLRADQLLSYQDLPKSMGALHELATRNKHLNVVSSPAPDSILLVIDMARKASILSSVAIRAPAEVPGIVRDKADPEGFRDRVIALFEEWLRLLPLAPDEKALSSYLLNLRATGMLELDDSTDRFLRLWIELSVSHALVHLEPPQAASAATNDQSLLLSGPIDGLVKLVTIIVAHGGGDSFLARFLGVLVGVIKRDSDERGTLFNGRPFLRIISGLIFELTGPEPGEIAVLKYLKTLSLALYSLQPISVPGFAFAWLEIIAHRSFMPKLLSLPHSQGGAYYEALLSSLLKFLEPYLRFADLTDSVRCLYKGTLRLLLVLLHDFPEFLCDNHHSLCDVIPLTCIQMRNLVLSAFPRHMRLPDPFTHNLKVDALSESSLPPRLAIDMERLLPESLRLQIDQYVKNRTPSSLPKDLVKRLLLGAKEAAACGSSFNIQGMNAIVLYIGGSAKPGSLPMENTFPTFKSPVADSRHLATPTPAMELFVKMVKELDGEGRNLMFNAIANQLRHPNSHTFYFSNLLLGIFSELSSDSVMEQITRVLLERIMVNKPHPWGLLVTFKELITNTKYNFWSYDFTRCSPEIEHLLRNVAQSCTAAMKHSELTNTGAASEVDGNGHVDAAGLNKGAAVISSRA